MENPRLANALKYNNTFLPVILDKFKRGQFIREFVLVESGCDYSFNLLPLLYQAGQTSLNQDLPLPHSSSLANANDVQHEPQRFSFLKSPFHQKHPHHSESTSSSTPSQLVQNLNSINSQYSIQYPPINNNNANNNQQTSQTPPVVHTTTTNTNPLYSYLQVVKMIIM